MPKSDNPKLDLPVEKLIADHKDPAQLLTECISQIFQKNNNFDEIIKILIEI